MTITDPTRQLATGHAVDLRRQAATARLAALARCCRPSAWARTGRRLNAMKTGGFPPDHACGESRQV